MVCRGCYHRLLYRRRFAHYLARRQISEKGIGNGISMLLFAGIIARGPSAVLGLIRLMKTGEAKYMILVPIIIVIFVLMIAFIIFMNDSERRIPIQYAKRVVGRKQYGGQSTYIPIKIAMSGVLPIIFAMAFMSIPQTLKMFITAERGRHGLLPSCSSCSATLIRSTLVSTSFSSLRSTISMFRCSITLSRSLIT